jgi:hypothetical protein
MSQTILGGSYLPPPRPTPATPERRDSATPQNSRDSLPSLAQFALNQSLHRSAPPAGDAATPENYQSLSLFKDADSGRFVALFRDGQSGEVIEQIPEDKVLEFYARLERELQRQQLTHPSGTVDLET